MTRKCRTCGTDLVIGENCAQYMIDNRDYICGSCNTEYRREYNREYNREHREHQREYKREYYYRKGIGQPMGNNRECSSFLGVHVAERVLSKVFKNVDKMSYGNPGYDFICGRGYKVDVKSSCILSNKQQVDCWQFHINHNNIADYFLCLAFNNRDDLTPLHVWLMPADIVNDHVSISISESTLEKWGEYALDVDKVSACCSVIRGVYS